MIFLTIGFAMIVSLVLQKPLMAIYFSQLEILIFLAYMFYELKNK